MSPNSVYTKAPCGIGIDLVRTEAIELALKRDEEAAAAWLNPAEITALGDRASLAHVLAGRIAAKEAVAKALGCGFSDDVSWQDIEISTEPDGKPVVTLLGGALDLATRLGISRVLVSISHVEPLAAATAIALRG